MSQQNNSPVDSSISQTKESVLKLFNQVQKKIALAKTFRYHNILVYNNREYVSPYDLASNGFVNRNFKEEEGEENSGNKDLVGESNGSKEVKPIICMCLDKACQKVIKLNNFLEQDKFQINQRQQQTQSISTTLTDHQQPCQFFKRQYSKIQINQLNQISPLIFQKIKDSYKKDSQKLCLSSISINFRYLEHILLGNQYRVGLKESIMSIKTTPELECYKKIDKKFNLSEKIVDKEVLLAIFGWRFSGSENDGQEYNYTLKCHFCGKKIESYKRQQQKGLEGDSYSPIQKYFHFYGAHNEWCLIKDKNYQIWKITLKKLYSIQYSQSKQLKQNLNAEEGNKISQANSSQQQTISKPRPDLSYHIPILQQEKQCNSLRFQIYQLCKPYLKRIQELKFNPQEVRKQIKRPINIAADLNKNSQHLVQHQNQHQTSQKNRNSQHQQKQISIISKCFQTYQNFHKVSLNCEQTIKKFINSIQIKRQ